MYIRPVVLSTRLRARGVLARAAFASQPASAEPKVNKAKDSTKPESEDPSKQPLPASTPKKKTMAELDEELRQKMSGLSGDGGESGVEYEDGQPVSMKRSVKNNMFRYI